MEGAEASLALPPSEPRLDEWDEELVVSWLDSIGYGGHHASIRDQGISGDVLSLLSSDDLRELGIISLGQRLGILKSVYLLKVAQGLPIEEDAWVPSAINGDPDASFDVPPTAAVDGHSFVPDTGRIFDMLRDQNERMVYLENEYSRLSEAFLALQEGDQSGIRSRAASTTPTPTPGFDDRGNSGLWKQPSIKWATYGRHLRSPTQPTPDEGPGMSGTGGLDSPALNGHDGLRRLNPKYSEPNLLGSSLASGARIHQRSSSLNRQQSSSQLSRSLPTFDLPPDSSAPSANIQPPPPSASSMAPLRSASPQMPTPPQLARVISATNLKTTGAMSLSSPSGALSPLASSPSHSPSSSSSVPPPRGSPKEAPSSSYSAPSSAAMAPSSSRDSKADRPPVTGTAENPQRFRVTLDDPCWKVLPAALKKYKINDDWRMYALFICYGTSATSSGTERCLSYDEKPLLLFQKLKEANQQPVFMLRHIRDIKSPIAIAQNKQALKLTSTPSSANQGSSSRPPNASSSATTTSSPTTSGGGANPSAPTLSSSDPSSSSTPNSHPTVPTYSKNTRLHQPSVLLPLSKVRNGGLETPETEDDPSIFQSSSSSSGGGGGGGGGQPGTPAATPTMGECAAGAGAGAGDAGPGDISYAISIYPYFAEREDEFDVVVDDTFIILSKAKGWWVVQRDPTGSGQVTPDSSKAGWVPAGCLLECNRPPGSGASRVQLSSIVSTSYPGHSLMDYTAGAEDEMSLVKDEMLRVFKRYSHWSYAVKEVGGERGWVPSWFIGRFSSSSSSAGGNTTTTSSLSGTGGTGEPLTPPPPTVSTGSLLPQQPSSSASDEPLPQRINSDSS